jgi:hypothetical protein
VTVAGNDNYNAASADIAVTVKDKTSVALAVTQDSGVYGSDLADPVFDTVEGASVPVIEYEGFGSTVYARSSEKPTLPGSYWVRVSYETGTSSYSGSARFDITKAFISEAIVALATQEVYNGSEQEVNISYVLLERILTLGTDYVITAGGSATNVGDVTLEITGIGNYRGTKTITWSLRKAEYD